MMAQKKDDYAIGTLKYWWCGKDPPVDNKWNARVGKFSWTLFGGTYDSVAQLYDFGAQNKYAESTINMNSVNFAFGQHFRLVFDIDLKFDGTTSTFVDFGSVAKSDHAIGFTILVTDGYVSASVNWKLNGNNSNPGLFLIPLPIPAGDTSLFQHFKGYFEIVDKGNGYDKCTLRINGTKYTCPVDVPKATYGPTWHSSLAFLGRGLASTQYNSNVKIRDLKIYQID